tara:strand:+ start:771 stop:2381 length:1611 start_codon:yes stop_codon:yes gene_type:complete
MFVATLGIILAGEKTGAQEKRSTPSATRVAIIGAKGYIGSHVHAFLLSTGMEVTGYDRVVQRILERPTTREPTVLELASRDIPDSVLHSFNAVIYLGGLTGRVACESATPGIVEAENVADPTALARRMRPDQLLIFASTSALLEGSGGRAVNESWIVQTALLDRYAGSMLAREMAMRLLGSEAASPRLVALRFGTVIGVSSGQRVDLAPMALTRSAFTSGVIRVSHPETMRAFLCLDNLSRAMKSLVTQHAESSKLQVYHLSSFNTNIAGLANAVAARTGARLEVKEHEPEDDVAGFSLVSTAFAHAFYFEFHGSVELVVKRLVDTMPESVTAKGVHAYHPIVGHGANASSIPCPVCGSHHLQEVLDLHEQPLANDFRSTAEAAVNANRYPLRLMRCKRGPRCNHMHLSKLVSRNHLSPITSMCLAQARRCCNTSIGSPIKYPTKPLKVWDPRAPSWSSRATMGASSTSLPSADGRRMVLTPLRTSFPRREPRGTSCEWASGARRHLQRRSQRCLRSLMRLLRRTCWRTCLTLSTF